MARNYFRRYIWLIELLRSYSTLTLEEIKDSWMHSSLNDEKKPLADRTFFNNIEAIREMFGISIACNRSTNEYFIDDEEDCGGGSIRTWLLDVLSREKLPCPTDVSPEMHISDMEDAVDVKLRVRSCLRDYIRTNRLHSSQKEVETCGEHSVFSYHLIPNCCFIQTLFSYIDSVEVLEPESLRREMREAVRRMEEMYKEE